MNDIIKYIDYKVETLSSQYPNIDFKPIRENAVIAFSNRTEPIEVLKQYIDAAFTNAINKLDTKVVEEPFVMTQEEETIYQGLKQEAKEKRNAMGLNNKKLVLENSFNSNRGVISHVGIIIFVAVAVLALAFVVWKVIF